MKFLYVIFLLSGFFASAQHQNTFIQFDATIPIRGNPDRDNYDNNEQQNTSFLLPDGIGAKVGFGLHHNEWIGLSAHSGIEWRLVDQLVTAPVFVNLRLAPKLGEETRIVAQFGYGAAFALGRGNLSGTYKKVSLGLENASGVALFAEISQYGFSFKDQYKIANISVGISLVTF